MIPIQVCNPDCYLALFLQERSHQALLPVPGDPLNRIRHSGEASECVIVLLKAVNRTDPPLLLHLQRQPEAFGNIMISAGRFM